MQEMDIAGEDFATFGTDDQQSQPNKAWINTSENNLLKSHWLVIIDSSCHQYILHLKLLLPLVLRLEDGDNGCVLFIGSYLGLEFRVATQRSCKSIIKLLRQQRDKDGHLVQKQVHVWTILRKVSHEERILT